jgi:hypothetical protein
MDYTLREHSLRAPPAREIKNGDIVFCGTHFHGGVHAAKHMNAPESIIF